MLSKAGKSTTLKFNTLQGLHPKEIAANDEILYEQFDNLLFIRKEKAKPIMIPLKTSKNVGSFFFKTTERINKIRNYSPDIGKYNPKYNTVLKSKPSHKISPTRNRTSSNKKRNDIIMRTFDSKRDVHTNVNFAKQLPRMNRKFRTTVPSPEHSIIDFDKNSIPSVIFDHQTSRPIAQKETFLPEYKPNKDVILSRLGKGCMIFIRRQN